MKTFLTCLLVSLACSAAFGQYAPGSVVANQQVVQQSPLNLPPPPSVGPGPSVPLDWMQNGFREEWKQIHEVRPIRDWEGYPNQLWLNQSQNQQVYTAPTGYAYPQQQQQWYYPGQGLNQSYPNTGCYQRDVYPQYACPQYNNYNYYQPRRWFGW